MAKKDKAIKEKASKEKTAKSGKEKSKNKDEHKSVDANAVSKKKSDKTVTKKSLKGKDLHDGGIAGEPAHQKSLSIGSKDGQLVAGSETGRNSTIHEWESEAIRKANLIADEFSCCIVLVMEDSPELSRFGEFLLRAVETGVRANFNCISGAQTAERVKRFMASHGQAVDDHNFMARQDLFAEAIKCTLLEIKEIVASEINADHATKEMELTGARSKDLVRYVAPLTISMQSGTGGDEEGEEQEGIREPPPAPPPTVQGLPAQTLPTKKGKSMKDSDINQVVASTSVPGPNGKPSASPISTPTSKMGVKTRMRKRGEVPMPEFELIDDSPPKGPRSYVLLQGFYNPLLIDELRKIGVKVDGILLMTDAKINRYNFSIMDVEDSIPGAFKPKIALPQYLKAMKKLSNDPETRNSEVIQFWTKLSEMYNNATTDSPFHDIALMNFPLPDPKRVNLENPEGLTYYISKVYDEIAKRIYEMLVLQGWFKEFTSAADVTPLQPLEPALPHEVYDQIVGQIPSECITVPILLEALVQQVAYSLDEEAGNPVSPLCYEENSTAGIITGKSSFGSINWGLAAPEKEKNDEKSESCSKSENDFKGEFLASSLFKVPMYIKSGDYASIRSCHLNESLASRIASCQLSGDIRNIRGYLWQKVPEFNKGLYMKLLGNLTHFMYFMPPDMIQFEDMFFILHLLMSAGVEVHLQKEAELRQKSLEALKEKNERNSANDPNFPGTNLSTDRNYIAVNKKTGVHLVISPNSAQELNVASLNPEKARSKSILDAYLSKSEPQFSHPTDTEEQSDSPQHASTAPHKKKERKRRKSKRLHHLEHHHVLDVNKAARVTTVGAIQSAAKYVENQMEAVHKAETEILEKRKLKKDKSKGKKGKAKEEDATPLEKQSVANNKQDGGGEDGEGSKPGDEKEISRDSSAQQDESNMNSEMISNLDDVSEKKGFSAMNYPSHDEKRFIACEEQWFEDIQETSVIQALLECPALLAINESGALDLNKWIEKYLLSAGMETIPGEAVLLGDLKNWNYVEELVPIQTVQMLNEASQEYLSMQRMYCPFYDTLLFIFNNPLPKEMAAESQFYFRLKTLPGLQHFLEYTMDDQNVLRWIEQLDAEKRLEVDEQTSINNLLSIIPEEQWLMVPSIKYQIMVDNIRSLSRILASESASGYKGASFHGQIRSSAKPSIAPGAKSIVATASGTGERASVGSKEIRTPSATAAALAAPESSSRVSIVEGKEASKPASTPNLKAISSKNSAKGAKSEKAERKSENAKTRKSQESIQNSLGSGAAAAAGGSGEGQSVPASIPTSPETAAFGRMEKSLEDGIRIPKEHEWIRSALNFTCYDLGKRVAVVGNDSFFLFPMDGTVIRYEISTIEPDFRMMQLTVSKNGHQTFFYPYYIPQDFDLSMEDYVVCPYFHMVLANGTIFAFQDRRAEEAAPYLKIAMNKKFQNQLFSFENVLFGNEVEKKMNEAAAPPPAEETEGERLGSMESGGKNDGRHSSDSKRKSRGSKDSKGSKEKADKQVELEHHDEKKEKGNKKGLKEKKSKKLLEKSPEVEKKKEGKKGKKNKAKAGKSELEIEDEEEASSGGPPTPSTAMEYTEEEETVVEEVPLETPPLAEVGGADEGLAGVGTADGGEWMYPSSENSEDEAAETQKRRLFFAPPWDDAVQLIQPMAHAFTITLPSGLMAGVEDLAGPPLSRIVKQHYVGNGSARSNIEGTRYYTMDGSVIKFLLSGSIQILTARGVTTTIDELAANAKRDTENLSISFGAATIVKIFNGEVILPNGHLWQVVNGKKVSKPPIYVFTSGPLSGGEVFRRRQDGVVYLHRYDGTVITHYPDGTRFTTRMVILEKNRPPPHNSPPPSNVNSTSQSNVNFVQPKEMEDFDDEFSDWVFVGLKYMIEHPNYSTVLFNTLSGNVHLKLPNGEWVRVFADGNVRISTEDQYCLDVDKNRALLSYPPCVKGGHALPNMTTVRLWHAAPPGLQTQEVVQPEPEIETLVPEGQTNPLRTEEPSQVVVGFTEPPEGDEHKGMDEKVLKKKQSKNVNQSKSLHPKVKLAKSRAKATRMSETMLGQSKTVTDTANAGAKGDGTKMDSTKFDGETDGEGESGEGDAAPPQVSPTDLPPPQPEAGIKPSLRKGCEMMDDFLQFNDETTFCKSVDSWDNRFLMNVYGGTVVDKVEKDDWNRDMSTQQLIETLSEHSHLPKNFISGILKNTSSENLETAARRIQALRKGYRDSCSDGLPKTKIFVVKRDLTAFQYLQKAHVNEIVTKAYGSRESMVIVDPVPKRQPRRYVTIMRPVEEINEPHGMWTRQYIEPMFRPRGITNKHLRVATLNELRWFGYILNTAHGKRPQFVPEPKELFRAKKSIPLETNESEVRVDKTRSIDATRAGVSRTSQTPSEGGLAGDDVGVSDEEGYSGEGEEEEGNSGEELNRKRSNGVQNDKKKDKKKDKKEKEKEPVKKAKGKEKEKEKRRKSPKAVPSSDEEEEGVVNDIESGDEEVSRRESGLSRRSSFRSQQIPDMGEYPDEIEDLKGIYEMGREYYSNNFPKITAKEHVVPCNTKKALVVRAFVEIPKVDENMQRALLAASMSYAETCKTEAAIYKTYKTEDPRSREEKVRQAGFKQQMIEQNVDEMHLLEQKPGPVLKFHF